MGIFISLYHGFVSLVYLLHVDHAEGVKVLEELVSKFY